ncbi:hypothetical protein GCM10011504_40510 [Siccirubricoccus deserti]|uniref:Uncharacterized protein n=1 Tax=Siccirubricoccus deserti TaxID=2013562 RepID=A0A9X0R0A0_9PROT|nr:hypothetical protein [Siccirubricoccus deserti]MBC4017316.1 hypothetical protein [Siccirubricoccus deserti]GGC58143.1 hypothetical protein GCM10011504_40510 [Siccirubricoccus deserti]
MTDDPRIVAPDPAGDAPALAVIGIAPLPGARRTPHLLVHVRTGPVVAVYAVAGLKRRQMQLRAPLAVNSAAGIPRERAHFECGETLLLRPAARCVTSSEAHLARKGVI